MASEEIEKTAKHIGLTTTWSYSEAKNELIEGIKLGLTIKQMEQVMELGLSPVYIKIWGDRYVR